MGKVKEVTVILMLNCPVYKKLVVGNNLLSWPNIVVPKNEKLT